MSGIGLMNLVNIQYWIDESGIYADGYLQNALIRHLEWIINELARTWFPLWLNSTLRFPRQFKTFHLMYGSDGTWKLFMSHFWNQSSSNRARKNVNKWKISMKSFCKQPSIYDDDATTCLYINLWPDLYPDHISEFSLQNSQKKNKIWW